GARLRPAILQSRRLRAPAACAASRTGRTTGTEARYRFAREGVRRRRARLHTTRTRPHTSPRRTPHSRPHAGAAALRPARGRRAAGAATRKRAIRRSQRPAAELAAPRPPENPRNQALSV